MSTHELTVRPRMLDVLGSYHEPEDIWSDYSGRSMYGRTCLGYTGEDVTLFAFRLAVELAREGEDEPDLFSVEEHLILLGDPRSDSMGRSVIHYWPNVQVTSAE